MAVVQLLFILLGYLLTRGFLGIFGKLHPEIDYHRFASGMLIFAGDYGLWFFLFPLG